MHWHMIPTMISMDLTGGDAIISQKTLDKHGDESYLRPVANFRLLKREVDLSG